MGVLHGALSAELADFMSGSETAEAALAEVAAAYETGARSGLHQVTGRAGPCWVRPISEAPP